MSYITVARCKEAMRSSYDGSDDSILTDILTSCCAFLDTYCQRSAGGFGVQTYDELYKGTGDRLLFVNNTPVVSIARIATYEQPCVSVKNNSTDMGTRATVAVTSTGITLTYIASAVTTTNTLTWVANPTLAQLVAAINLLGNNWTAQVMGGFGTWSSADIRATQGAYGARITNAYLYIHWFDVTSYRVNEVSGEIYNPSGFNRGSGDWNYRVTYTAGYSSFPDDLTQALAELVAAVYYAREVNANLSSESLGPMSYGQLAEKMFDGMSPLARNTFNRYRIRRIPKFSTW